jgi:hypothetical protein
MIPFFRKLRKKLADDNKPLKYMRYALGEIVLVVIGILIALQVNNWNEKRLNYMEEKRILKALSEELKLRRFLFAKGTEQQENSILSAKNLLMEMQSPIQEMNIDRLDKDIDRITSRWLSGTPTSIYDALIGSGELKLISSEELRNALAQLKSDQEFLRLFEELQVKFVDDKLSPFLNQYINRSAIRLKGMGNPQLKDIPLMQNETDYNKMLRNNEFANLLVESIEHTSRVISNYKRLERVVNSVDSLANIGNNGIENLPALNTK